MKRNNKTDFYVREIFFCKDVTGVPANGSTTAAVVVEGRPPLQEFADRYKALRLFIQDMTVPRLKEIFRVRAGAVNKDYPECKTIENFLYEYRTGVYDNKKRALVDMLCNRMWGKECFGVIEKMVMEKLKLRYKDALVSGDKVKTRRSHGNIKIMINRMRQTLFIDRFR